MLTAGLTGLGYSNFNWRGAQTSTYGPSTISAKAGSVSWKAVDGVYAVSRNDGHFDWARANNSNVQSPSFNALSGCLVAPYAWEPCLDWSVPVVVFENINQKASVVVKAITCYEIQPELGSQIQDLASVSAVDMSAIAMYKAACGQFGCFYPADFNDWGTLWQGVKEFFSHAKAPLMSVAGMIPGVGPILSGIINQIPTQTKKSRENALKAAKEKAEREAKIEAAKLKEAEAILSRGTTAKTRKRMPPPKPRNRRGPRETAL